MNRYLLPVLFFLLSVDAKSADITITSALNSIKTIQSSKSDRTDRRIWRSELKWSDECESSFNYPDSVSGLDVYPVKDNEYILRVTCTFGSYQGQHQLYFLSIGDKIQSKAIELPQYKIESNKAVIKKLSPLFWGEILEGSSHSALKILNLYSGFGHCGTLTTYKFMDGKMVATRLKAQPDCESKKKEREPENWHEYKLQ